MGADGERSVVSRKGLAGRKEVERWLFPLMVSHPTKAAPTQELAPHNCDSRRMMKATKYTTTKPLRMRPILLRLLAISVRP